jgi:hypothetical protein
MVAHTVKSFVQISEDLIKAAIKPGSGNTKFLDVVEDVLNVLPVHWICNDIVRAFGCCVSALLTE